MKIFNQLPLLGFIYMLFFLVSYQCTDTSVTPSTPAISADTVVNHYPDWFCSSIETFPDKADKAQQAVGYKGKCWPVGTVLKVGFVGTASASAIAMVKKEAAEWTQSANISFTYPVNPPYDIRIAFNSSSGAWSYVGTDNKSVASNNPTMNLGWLAPDVIKHEFGHAIGLLHEHQNPQGGICWNEANVIYDLTRPPNSWTVPMIRFNVLDKHDPSTVLTSAWDKVSIMHYNIPARWTCNNTAIPGGQTISQADKDFIKARYPGIVEPNTSVTLTAYQIDDILKMYEARLIDSTTQRLKRSNEAVAKMLDRVEKKQKGLK
jgi:hypothetical protein